LISAIFLLSSAITSFIFVTIKRKDSWCHNLKQYLMKWKNS
jgi:hypothetical protein